MIKVKFYTKNEYSVLEVKGNIATMLEHKVYLKDIYKLVQEKVNFDDEIEGYVIAKKNEHFCEYCGELTHGSDEEVLCDECRMTFGHTYYNEL